MTIRQFLKFLFHRKSGPLIGSLIFVWVTISLYVDLNTTKDELIPHVGKLVGIDSVITKVKNKPLFKEITKQLRLTLDTESSYFTSITTSNFASITSQIDVGDNVTIYTKYKKLGIFGLKKNNEMSQLTKGNIEIIDYKHYQKTIQKMIFLCGFFSLAFLVWFIVWARPRWSSIQAK